MAGAASPCPICPHPGAARLSPGVSPGAAEKEQARQSRGQRFLHVPRQLVLPCLGHRDSCLYGAAACRSSPQTSLAARQLSPRPSCTVRQVQQPQGRGRPSAERHRTLRSQPSNARPQQQPNACELMPWNYMVRKRWRQRQQDHQQQKPVRAPPQQKSSGGTTLATTAPGRGTVAEPAEDNSRNQRTCASPSIRVLVDARMTSHRARSFARHGQPSGERRCSPQRRGSGRRI